MNDDMEATGSFSHGCDGNTGIGCARREDDEEPPP